MAHRGDKFGDLVRYISRLGGFPGCMCPGCHVDTLHYAEGCGVTCGIFPMCPDRQAEHPGVFIGVIVRGVIGCDAPLNCACGESDPMGLLCDICDTQVCRKHYAVAPDTVICKRCVSKCPGLRIYYREDEWTRRVPDGHLPPPPISKYYVVPENTRYPWDHLDIYGKFVGPKFKLLRDGSNRPLEGPYNDLGSLLLEVLGPFHASSHPWTLGETGRVQRVVEELFTCHCRNGASVVVERMGTGKPGALSVTCSFTLDPIQRPWVVVLTNQQWELTLTVSFHRESASQRMYNYFHMPAPDTLPGIVISQSRIRDEIEITDYPRGIDGRKLAGVLIGTMQEDPTISQITVPWEHEIEPEYVARALAEHGIVTLAKSDDVAIVRRADNTWVDICIPPGAGATS